MSNGFTRSSRGGFEKTCYSCHQSGHVKSNCPVKMVCYGCGSEDHKVSECTKESKSLDYAECYKCQERGHFAKNCPLSEYNQGSGTGGSGGGYGRRSWGQGGGYGRDGGRDGGYGGGSDRDRCYICKKSGHFKMDCPMRDTKHNLCYRCGSDQHLLSECTSEKKTLEYAHCYTCNEKGHFSNDCPNGGGMMMEESENVPHWGSNRDAVYRQRGGGGMSGRGGARPRMEKKCFACRQVGHFVDQCPQRDEGRHDLCFRCGSSEHRLADCTSKSKKLDYVTCFICSEKGHLARDCPQNDKGVYPEGGSCRDCGSVDHKIKDCPNATSEDGGAAADGEGS